MRVNTQQNIKTVGSLGGERIAMGFDESSIAHIMSVLTDLYSNPELAVIREYSTNALDANIAAGNNDPIEVTLPSSLSPYFRVKDQGVGLSADDLRYVYSKYGASTKRDTDEQTGMLGLGCKSGLTYTSSFNIVAVKDGIKTQAVVTRQNDGRGVVEIVDEAKTADHNGVEIVIPAKNPTSFHQQAKAFFRFWKQGTVLLNGAEPTRIDGRWVSDTLLIVDDNTVNTDYVVMGNVAYPVSRRISQRLPYSNHIVAWVPMGSVAFTPSREALHYTQVTNKTLTGVQADFDARWEKAARDEVEAAKTHAEAYKLAQEWRRMLNVKYTYRGEVIPEQFKVEGYKFSLFATRYATSQVSYLTGNEMTGNLLIHGYDAKANLSSHQKRKVRNFVEQTFDGEGIRMVYLTDQPFGDKWLDGVAKRIPWSQVQAFRMPRSKGGSRGKQKFQVLDAGGYFREMDDIPSDDIIYFSPSEEDVRAALTQALFPDWSIVKLGKNRHEKFKRENPGARTLSEALAEVEKEILDNLTDADRIVLTAEWGDADLAKRLKAATLLDPELKAAVDTLATNYGSKKSAAVVRYENFVGVARSSYYSVKPMKRSRAFDNYPLLYTARSNIKTEHLTEYVNSVYTARQGN